MGWWRTNWFAWIRAEQTKELCRNFSGGLPLLPLFDSTLHLFLFFLDCVIWHFVFSLSSVTIWLIYAHVVRLGLIFGRLFYMWFLCSDVWYCSNILINSCYSWGEWSIWSMMLNDVMNLSEVWILIRCLSCFLWCEGGSFTHSEFIRVFIFYFHTLLLILKDCPIVVILCVSYWL